MENTSLKLQIKKRLKDLSDEKYKNFHSNLCPNINNILGVRTPILRDYAKELLKQYDYKVLINNIDNEYYEEKVLQGMIIGFIKDDINIIFKYIENFVPKIDNWATCDIFCAGLKVTKKYKKEVWELLKKYINSTNEFEIRFGIVMILDYYIEETYLEEDFKIFEKIQSKEYYVQMAIAWAISICLIKYFERTRNFLEKSKIDKFIYNKALQKGIESFRITNEKKDILRKMKK